MPRFKYIASRKLAADGTVGIRFPGRVFRAASDKVVCERIEDIPDGATIVSEARVLADVKVGERYKQVRAKRDATVVDVPSTDFVAVRYFRLAKTVTGEPMWQEVP